MELRKRNIKWLRRNGEVNKVSSAIVPLVSICDFQGGTQPPKSQWITENKDGYIRMLQIRDFTQERTEKEYVPLKTNLKTCEEKDILIARYGASIGKILTGQSGAYNVAIIKTIPDERRILKKYLFYYLKSEIFQNFISNVGTRAAQAGFNKQDLKGLNIYLPSLSNQQQIVDLLEKSQLLIDKRKKQLAGLYSLTQSIFLEMFGDPILNSKNWSNIEFQEVINDIRYGTSTPPTFSDDGFMFIRATNIKKGKVLRDNMFYISKEEASKIQKCKLSLGEIIFVRSGVNSGDNAVVTEEFAGHYGGYDIIVNINEDKVNPFYLNSFFNSIYLNLIIKPLTRRAGQPHLNADQIKSLNIQVPPLDLQNKFEGVYNKIELQKRLLRSSLAQLESNFNSLIQRAFKGELFNDQANLINN